MSCTRAETDGVIVPRRHGQADEAGQLVHRRRHHQEAKVLRGTRVFARLVFRRFPTTRMCIPLRFSRCCAIKTQNHVFVTDWSMRGSVVPDSMTSCQRAGVLLACVLLARTVCNRTDLGACPLPPLAARIPPYAGLDASIVDSRLPSRLSRCLARSPTLVTRLLATRADMALRPAAGALALALLAGFVVAQTTSNAATTTTTSTTAPASSAAAQAEAADETAPAVPNSMLYTMSVRPHSVFASPLELTLCCLQYDTDVCELRAVR